MSKHFHEPRSSTRLTAIAGGTLLALTMAAIAAPNTTPKSDGSGMSCRCTCTTLAGAYGGDKNINWTGSRGDCQALSGTACKLNKPDKDGNNYGSSTGCDVILTFQPPKGNRLKNIDPNKLQQLQRN